MYVSTYDIHIYIYTVVLKKNLRVHERAARVLTLTRKDSHRVRDAYVHFARVNARVSLACHATTMYYYSSYHVKRYTNKVDR